MGTGADVKRVTADAAPNAAPTSGGVTAPGVPTITIERSVAEVAMRALHGAGKVYEYEVFRRALTVRS